MTPISRTWNSYYVRTNNPRKLCSTPDLTLLHTSYTELHSSNKMPQPVHQALESEDPQSVTDLVDGLKRFQLLSGQVVFKSESFSENDFCS
jgi:hypothetical protein